MVYMHDPSSKKTSRRIVVYGFMTLAVVALSIALFFAMLGWRYNQNKNTFIQGGLVQFISQPSGANVQVNDIRLANKTRSKITLNPGEYNVKMTLNGYRDWEKSATIKSGTVLWLNSAHFVPNNPNTSSVFSAPAITSAAMQEDGRRIALMTDRAVPTITLLEANDDTPTPKVVTVPDTLYKNAAKSSFEIIKQSGDSRRLLLKHTFNDGAAEWLMVDQNAVDKSYVIAQDEGVSVQAVQFDPSSSDRAYVHYSDGSIRRLDLSNGERSDVVASNVQDFTLTSSGWLFYSTKPASGIVTTAYVSEGKKESRTIQTLATDQPAHIAAGRYFDTFYTLTAVNEQATLRAYETFPSSDSKDAFKPRDTTVIRTSTPISFASFKANGRFAVLQQARMQTVYDIDLKKKSDVAIEGLTTDLMKPLQWLGTFHFWNDVTGFARQYEFDGTNQQPITEVTPGYPAAYSPNQKYFYTIRTTDSGVSLQRTLMVLN
jgi:hypothetical protein